MMESAEMPPMKAPRPVEERAPWALTGAKGRAPNVISSIYIDPVEEEKFNLTLLAKQRRIEANEVRFRDLEVEDAEIIVVAFGTAGRVCQSAVKAAREEGIKVGLLKLVVVWPFADERIDQLAGRVKGFVVPEINFGQISLEVERCAHGKARVIQVPHAGGGIHDPDKVLEAIRRAAA